METKATLLINEEKTACGCGSCGLIFEIYEGKLSKDSSNHFSFTCDACLNKPEYKITITFKTDRRLTSHELNALESHLMLQIDEPVNEDQEPETYETSNANYKTERIN